MPIANRPPSYTLSAASHRMHPMGALPLPNSLEFNRIEKSEEDQAIERILKDLKLSTGPENNGLPISLDFLAYPTPVVDQMVQRKFL